MTKLEVFRNGNLYLIERNGFFLLCGMLDGKRVRRSCQTKDLAEAKRQLFDLQREYLSGWRSAYDRPDIDWKSVAIAVHKRHRTSARERNIPFNLEVEQVFILMHSTGFCCAVSGVPFSKQTEVTGWRDPWAPSIDRIEGRQGYVPDNIRIVSLIANTAMNSWGYDTLLRLARGVVRNSSAVSVETELVRERYAERSTSAQLIEFKRDA